MDHEGRVIEPAYKFEAARCACSYEGIAKRLITAYKDGDEQRLADIIANEMLCVARGQSTQGSARVDEGKPPADWTQIADAVIPIPANPVHLRKRGWNHMGMVAERFARGCQLPLLDILVSSKAADQRQLGRDQRMANRSGSFSLRQDASVPCGGTVMLIDDVLTTGATCNAATQVLKSAGVGRVLVVTFARVW